MAEKELEKGEKLTELRSMQDQSTVQEELGKGTRFVPGFVENSNTYRVMDEESGVKNTTTSSSSSGRSNGVGSSKTNAIRDSWKDSEQNLTIRHSYNEIKETRSSFRLTQGDGSQRRRDGRRMRQGSVSLSQRIFDLPPSLSRSVTEAMDSGPMLVLVCLITLWSLYGPDIQYATQKTNQSDDFFEGLMFACFIYFCAEWCVSVLFIPNYTFSFWFWLDIFATLTMVLDIPMLGESITGNMDAQETQSLQSARAGRAARIGARAGRLGRLMRLLRFVRLLRFLKYVYKRNNMGRSDVKAGVEEMKPTVVGRVFVEQSTRKVVLFLLATLISSSFITTSSPDTTPYSGMEFLENRTLDPMRYTLSSSYPVEYMQILHVGDSIPTVYIPWRPGASHIRSRDLSRVEGRCSLTTGYCSVIELNVSSDRREEALMSLTLTSIIILLLGIAACAFSRDANQFIVIPIHNMMVDILKATQTVDIDLTDGDGDGNEAERLETEILESSVKKMLVTIEKSRQAMWQEKRIADLLLNSMVPGHIAMRLKAWRWWDGPQDGKVIADSFPSVTVLFTDIVGFTRLSSRISPEECVVHLNNMYTYFDDILERHGLYKVETIGDSYMLVGGAPKEQEDHAARVAAAAIELKECVPMLQEISNEPTINVRIGMHSGSVVAGVVGFKNPRWHLFGDTCNTASRMESTGIPGEVQLSQSTNELIKDQFECRARGTVEIKGKGQMQTYILVGRNKVDVGGGQPDKYEEKDAEGETPQIEKMRDVISARRKSLQMKEEELAKMTKSQGPSEAVSALKARGLSINKNNPESTKSALNVWFQDFDLLSMNEQKEVVSALLTRM